MWLVTADLHLTDSPRDAYRFGIFNWLAQQQEKYDVDSTFILGDLTDKKDRHSAVLVNRIVDELKKLKPPVYILRGNHDGINPDTPFFKFLNSINGIKFVTKPLTLMNSTRLIPHCHDQAEFDAACRQMADGLPAVMLHQLVDGAIGETGRRLTGVSTSLIESKHPKVVWAGDIHKPQDVGCVSYVGAPYHTRFGDNFQPRVVLYDSNTGRTVSLLFVAPYKWALTVRDAGQITEDQHLNAGDHVKVTVELAREEAIEWASYRKRIVDACKARGLDIYGLNLKVLTNTRRERKRIESKATSPEEVFLQFCRAENVASNIQQVGVELMKGE